MTEKINMELKDEQMVNAAGGVKTDEHGMPKYDEYGKIVKYLGDQKYLVKTEKGTELTGVFEYRHILDEGTDVGLEMLAGGWAIHEISELDY